MRNPTENPRNRIKQLVGLVVSTVVLTYVAFAIAYYVIDPDFSVTSQRNPGGDLRIDIRPNFVVGSVYEVTITDVTGIIAHRKEPRQGEQSILISGPPLAGSSVTVTCNLQYDRGMAACISTSTKMIVIP